MTQYDINLRDYLRILRRRKGIVILVPLLFGVFAFSFALLQAPKPVYRATALVRVERAVSASALLQELVTFNPQGNLETQAALIKGFPVMSLAAKKLGLIPQDVSLEQIRASAPYLKTITDLQERVQVKPLEGTSLIEISATSRNRDEVVRIANSLAEAFQEDNFATRTRQVAEAREFIERQLQEVGSRLRDSEDELRAFKEANKILLLPEETRGVLSRLATLDGQQAGIRRTVAETEDQLRLLDEDRALGRQLGPPPDAADPALSKLYTSLSERLLERDNLLLTLTPTHPQVQELDAQMANLLQSLREGLRSRLQTLRGRADEVRRAIAGLKQQQAAIPETDLKITRMEREVKLSERIFSLLKEKHQEVLIREKEQVGEVSLVRPAMRPVEPTNPAQPLPKAAVGLVIGLVVGFVLAFVIETLDTSIGAIDDVESFLETHVLGVIPYLDVKAELSKEHGREITLDQKTRDKYAFLPSLFLPESRVVEAFRVLRTNLLFSGLERELRTLMVTSSAQMEGKTTVAINLAIALAQLGKRTLLVEADLRNPFLHHAFGIPKDPGFTEVLAGTARLDDAVRGFPDLILGTAGVDGLIDRPGADNLFLLPSGHQPVNPAEFLSAQGVVNLLAEARARYDYVILDCAPILPVADPSILGARVDGVLMVVRVGTVARAALRRAKALLEGAKARVLGVCLTGVRAELSPDYADAAYYQYRHGAREPKRAMSPGWPGWPGWLGSLTASLKGYLTRGLKALAVLLLLLLAFVIGFLVWAYGPPKLRFLSALSVASARVVRSADQGLPNPGLPKLSVPPPPESPGEPTKPGAPEDPKSPAEASYRLQLHVFRTEEQALQAVARYRARGIRAYSAEAVIPGSGRWWWIFAGEFTDRDEAEAFGQALIRSGRVEEFMVVKQASGP